MMSQRIFSPGSEWVYLKIYSGPKMAEKLLIQEVAPLISKLEAKGLIDRFFFLRYTDPDYHLRIRVHLTHTSHVGEVLSLFQKTTQSYIEARIVWKYTIDTYIRELERYGDSTIEDVEELFCFHSKAALVLAANTDTEIVNDRWLWACRYIDMVLDEFGMSTGDKIELWKELSEGFLREYNADKNTRINLDLKSRQYKDALDRIMTCGDDDIELVQHLSVYAACCKEAIRSIRSKRDAGTLEVRFNSLLGSIIHMHFNRVLRTQQRTYELVIYYIMSKYHTSKAARMKYAVKEIISQ